MILSELISLDVLRVIWWLLLGVLLIGFALTDGFDLGVGALVPFVGKTDAERRVAINTVGPVWEGNQVWFILGGGAIFAAWPPLYAVSFSGFYLAMFLILAALILRPVGFKYRSKRDSHAWRNGWDWALFVGGAVPALVFGVAVGNVLQGVPFELTPDLMPLYPGNFIMKLLGLLNPYALLAGVVSLSMLLMHGAAWLSVKTEGTVKMRATAIGSVAGMGGLRHLYPRRGLARLRDQGLSHHLGGACERSFQPSSSRPSSMVGKLDAGLFRPPLDRDRTGPRSGRDRHGDAWSAGGA